MAISPQHDEERYSRLELIPWWDQALLRRARVLVVGAGALGNEIVKNLALLGVGKMLICDMDRIERSNLSRSILFRAEDDGEPKAEVAARRAREINPDVDARPFVGNVLHDLGLGIFLDFDVVIAGLDNREARLHLNQCCWKTNRPWIDGAIEAFHGIARVFVPPDGACYECTMSEADYLSLRRRQSCTLLTREEMEEGKVPTTPTTASVIAGIQCQEAVKLLHGRPVLVGKGFFFNGLSFDSFTIDFPRKEACFSHDTYEGIEAMPWRTDTVTAGEVVAYVKDCMGSEAVVELEREIVQSLDCAHCRTSERCYAPLSVVTEVQAICPDCGADRRPRLLHTLDDDPAYAVMTLAAMGIPPLDVVTGRVGMTCRHFTLHGDRDTLLGWLDAAVEVG